MRRLYFSVAIFVCAVLIGIVLFYTTKPVELTWKVKYQNHTVIQRSVLEFYDGERDLAHLTVDSFGEKVRFSLWHRKGTIVKTLKIKITPDTPSEIYLLSPPFGWKSVSYHQSRDGLSSVFESEDLGIQGEGTVTLEFLVMGLNSKNVSIYYQVEFSMEEGLKRFVGRGEGVLKVCQ